MISLVGLAFSCINTHYPCTAPHSNRRKLEDKGSFLILYTKGKELRKEKPSQQRLTTKNKNLPPTLLSFPSLLASLSLSSFLLPATPCGCDSPPSPLKHHLPLPKEKEGKHQRTMVFPSVPVFLDPPSWNQQQSQPATGGIVGAGGDVHHLPPALPTRVEPNMASSARPTSMADRAHLAKVPQPEPGLKCPRCESTNTKFCYFNNYSLSQPRHFCKTCRRYWTRGGSLRNVPVGGGCRRNKRSKSGSGSKSSAADRQAGAPTASASPAVGISAVPSNIPPHPQLPYMPHLADHYGAASNIGISFPGIQQIDTVDFQIGSHSVVGLEQWKLPQFHHFPLSAGLDPPPPQPSMGLFTFDGEEAIEGSYTAPVHGKQSASGLITHLASVKMEENPPGLNFRRNYLGITGSDQYWGAGGGAGAGEGSGSTVVATSSGSGWMDLAGFHTSSTSNIM
ncbi:hypothetical protein Taro_048653 [Colocasia esculenta]|uniref:Dof zinc finger protein n=1 Tax=Colocasia esculenta TaxID=4460 RepID=A0A843X8R2_COLES|nr:hypothetical protein [Colocasia esculenta]